MAGPSHTAHRPSRRVAVLAFALLAIVLAALAWSTRAPADSLEERLDRKEARLDDAQGKKSLLTTEVSRYNAKIDQLTGEVAALRNREAVVQQELTQAQSELDSAVHDLNILRERLQRSLAALRERLVDIYKADEPDAISAVLESDGFDDALSRYEYLQTIQTTNSDIAGRVRELRDDKADTVAQVRATRDSIAARKEELERTRLQLEACEAELAAARERSKRALSRVSGRVDHLHEEASKIEDKIQKRLAAIAAEQSGVPALPAGDIQGASGGFIWPVNGPVVSPFGQRWGRLHAGIDIAVPAGTPIRAVKDGSIAFAQDEASSGGYGNFTCIDHGGGLSSCYAHQSSFAITSGSVSQGDVIGYVGCTGHCYGDHLHFEFRVNGSPVDPMGYL